MKFSFNLVTRERLSDAILCMMSLLHNVKNKEDVEAIVVLDDDDEESIKGFTQIKKYLDHLGYNIKIIITQRIGFYNIHYYHKMAFDVASGDFLFVWCDDHYCITRDWDVNLWNLLSSYKDQPIFFHLNDIECELDHPFPTSPGISKKWFEITGNFSNRHSADAYTYKVAKHANLPQIKPTPEEFSLVHFHRKYDKLPKDKNLMERDWKPKDIKLERLPKIDEDIEKLKNWRSYERNR